MSDPVPTFFDDSFQSRVEAVLSGQAVDPAASTPSPGTSDTPAAPAATPAASPQPATTPVAPEPEEPAPKTAAEWKKFREARAAERQERDKIKAELETMRQKAAPVDQNEIATLRKAKEDLENQFKALAVEKTPEFQQKYVEAEKKFLGLAKSALPGEKAELQTKLAQLMQMPESEWRTEQIEALVTDLSPYRQKRVLDAVSGYDMVTAEKQQEIEASRNNWQQVLERQRQEVEKATKAERQVFESLVAKAKTDLDWFKHGADAAANQEVEQRLTDVERLFNSRDPETRTKVALLASVVPALQKQLSATVERAQAAESQLEAFKKGSPTPTTGGEGATTLDEKGEDLAARLARMAMDIPGMRR